MHFYSTKCEVFSFSILPTACRINSSAISVLDFAEGPLIEPTSFEEVRNHVRFFCFVCAGNRYFCDTLKN